MHSRQNCFRVGRVRGNARAAIGEGASFRARRRYDAPTSFVSKNHPLAENTMKSITKSTSSNTPHSGRLLSKVVMAVIFGLAANSECIQAAQPTGGNSRAGATPPAAPASAVANDKPIIFTLSEGKLPVLSTDHVQALPRAAAQPPAPKAGVTKRSATLPPAAQKSRKADATGAIRVTAQRGDTLSRIAKAFQISVDKIKDVNGIKEENKLMAGQKLDLPLGAGPITYIVQRHDTLSGIAKATGTQVAVLASENHIADPDKIQRGMKLVVPRTETPKLPKAPTAGTPVEAASTAVVKN